MKIKLLLTVFALVYLLPGYGQEFAVVLINGAVKVSSNKQDAKSLKSLIYGPLNGKDVLHLPKNAQVKLVKADGSVCEIAKEGVYEVGSLLCSKADKSSLVEKFGNYFVSFFEVHPSSESKENYKNNIYAISRGEPSIVLEFPFSGVYPSEADSIEFSWAHACDTCHYQLNVYNEASKTLIFQRKTSQKKFKLLNPKKYLKVGISYYWNVVSDTSKEIEYSNRLILSAKGDYLKTLNGIQNDIKSSLPKISYVPKTLFIMNELKTMDRMNYALLYSNHVKLLYPKDKNLVNLTDRFYFDELKQKLAN